MNDLDDITVALGPLPGKKIVAATFEREAIEPGTVLEQHAARTLAKERRLVQRRACQNRLEVFARQHRLISHAHSPR
ncbi:hypothetical protein D3C77_693450 [compost metagenome]